MLYNSENNEEKINQDRVKIFFQSANSLYIKNPMIIIVICRYELKMIKKKNLNRTAKYKINDRHQLLAILV